MRPLEERIIKGYSFDDVLLEPKHGQLSSRKDADLRAELVKDYWLSIPIISANMPSVTGLEMARAIYGAGGIGALHRFQTVQEQVDDYLALADCGRNAIVSFGLDDGERIEALYHAGARLFLLDVAHADSQRVLSEVEWFNQWYSDCKLIVGNVATSDAAWSLASRGVDAIKVGIGPGAACVTREVTGFGVPQLTAINRVSWIKRSHPDIRIIADGGCKNSGDIAKAIAAGADTVMLGRLLAGADEAPDPGEYYGNASKKINGHHAPEGEHGEIETEGPVSEILKKLCWGLRSAVSYSGGTCLADLRYVRMIECSPLTQVESGTRL